MCHDGPPGTISLIYKIGFKTMLYSTTFIVSWQHDVPRFSTVLFFSKSMFPLFFSCHLTKTQICSSTLTTIGILMSSFHIDLLSERQRCAESQAASVTKVLHDTAQTGIKVLTSTYYVHANALVVMWVCVACKVLPYKRISVLPQFRTANPVALPVATSRQSFRFYWISKW